MKLKVSFLLAVLSLSLVAHDMYVVDKEGRVWRRRENGWERVEKLPDRANPNPFDIGFRRTPGLRYGELHFDNEGNAALETSGGIEGSGFSLLTADNSLIPFEAMVWDGHGKVAIRQVLPMPRGAGFVALTGEGELLRIEMPPSKGPLVFKVTTLAPKKTAWALTGLSGSDVVIEKFDGSGHLSLDPADSKPQMETFEFPNNEPAARGKFRVAPSGFLRIDAPERICTVGNKVIAKVLKAARLQPTAK